MTTSSTTIESAGTESRPPLHNKATDRATLSDIAHRAMVERGLEPDFAPRALQELATIDKPAPASLATRDLRDKLWASIDNDDSLDLDQLTYAEALGKDRVRVLVAIADVDALVHKGSAIDSHAAQNTTSVYTPAAIFPMLPEKLSTGLTSLNEEQDRVAVVADMVFEANGTLSATEFYSANVRNHAKLAYLGTAAWLSGKSAAIPKLAAVEGLGDNLRLQDSVAQLLLSVRHRHGALSLQTIEPRAIFSGDNLANFQIDPRNRAQQLIEDFMIAANGATAAFLASKNFPSLRRVLKSPERWDRIVQLAAGMDEKLPAEPDAVALEAFLERRQKADPEKFPDVSLAVVKLIGRGEYTLDPPGGPAPGHFGLAVKDYTHSTAPNRRFPDLITQRLIKAALAGKPLPYTLPELEALAKHCTEREDDASKVERRTRKSAAALLLSGRIGERFDAIVTGAAAKGTWVRLLQLPAEGRLEKGFQGVDVGDRIQVKLVHTDVQLGFIDFVRE